MLYAKEAWFRDGITTADAVSPAATLVGLMRLKR